MVKNEESFQLHPTLDHQVRRDKEAGGPIMITYSIMYKCEGPSYVTDNEIA